MLGVVFIACYSPMIILKQYHQDGTKDFKFLGKCQSQDIAASFSEDLKYKKWFDSNYVIVPCGNCIGCRLDYSSTWADRMLCESFDHDAIFITITYDDDNLPISDCSGFETLRSEHIDKFIKDLRNYFRSKQVRYCLATEYGDLSLRPHCHLIIYGLTIDDLKPQFYKVNSFGSPTYTSDVLSELWKYGFNYIQEANWFNMAYTARYILKKQKGESAAEYSAFDIEPPKFRMSRRPGIGCNWLLENYKELYENGYISVPRHIKSSGKILPNRYFDKLLSDIDPDLLRHSKAKRHLQSYDYFHQKLDNSSMDLDHITEFYEFEKSNFLKKSNLNRDNLY